MLYNLSLKNIKKSFKDYAIYFVTLILGVCIFYLFNSMDSQTAILEVTSRQSEMIDLLEQILSYISVFVSFILGFLIIYASRFLIKKRNKEFGVYMTLGMSKRKISLLLLIETFIIGLISLAFGLLLGIVLSQITSIFVANLFEANMSKFTFNFSKTALFKTILYFGIIYFIVMIFNTIIVNKNKLIDLLQASKKQEKIRIKSSMRSVILFFISVLMLGSAYYMVTAGVNDLLKYDVSILLVPILLGTIGTILFFYSVAGISLKIISKCHNLYSKKLNTFVFKQINSKINTMVISISIICLMLFVTLCLLTSAFTIKDYFNNSINTYAPVDYQIVSINQNVRVTEFLEDTFVKENTKDNLVVSEYYDENFDYAKSLGKVYEQIKQKYSYIQFDSPVYIMSEADYNKLARLLKIDTVTIQNDEYAIVSNYNTDIYESVLKSNSTMIIFNHELKPYKKLINGFVNISGNPANLGFFVVSDQIIEKDHLKYEILSGNYNSKDQKIIDKLEEKVKKFHTEETLIKDTRNEIEISAAGLTAIITFIGLYLGIIFLISSSAILALKELSDCIDDKKKYKILRQIGADEKEINKALFMQTFIFFMMPLSIAAIHTIFGLKFCEWILKSLGITSILNGSYMTFIFLILIYGIYFIITYLCSKNIIRERI
ncbi:MAG: ABC transporter permease [Bacilli bacterium]|nr:ABC transporter permease [Bacilli bacterium]